ncbi:DEAD/DEAH box helicase [Hyphobacterium sp.]|uniref:DEAD/DEAH box helicase n=1 Tax=Hyphobacterium sp. TaxID=2004662 RepID=UPI003747FABD
MTTATIQQTIDDLRLTLTQYIEATYHISHPAIVQQRRELLSQIGGIFQAPYLESTPRYKSSKSYKEIQDLPQAALEALRTLSDPSAGKPVIYGSPYLHQLEALQETLSNGRNLMIMTGTGSGKTESFLLPILGKLAIEAREHPQAFHEHHAVRALVLYPMNALVNDQLGRLRTLFGDPRTIALFENWAKRPALFARYTSRTPYAGLRSARRDGSRLASIGEFFGEIEDAKRRFEADLVNEEDARAAELFATLQKRGKWPAKESVSDWLGKPPTPWAKRANRRTHDAELLTRHEVHTSPPDLLITNYSMLEYMMMRPIERPIFDATRKWLQARPDEKFLVVLDEAHLYRGAQGAEVGLLLRRLRERLGVPSERFQVICATASFSEEGKKNAGGFGAQLSGVPSDTFKPIKGEYLFRDPAARGTHADATALAAVDLDQFYSADPDERASAVASFLAFRKSSFAGDLDAKLYQALREYAPFNRLVNETMLAAVSLSELPEVVFDCAVPADVTEKAIGVLLALGSRAREKPGEASLLPCRIHSFFRGLPGLWICMNAECSDEKAEVPSPAGRLFSQPHERCTCCNAPVLEYFTCRHCGTSYARAYTNDVAHPRYLWAKEGERIDTASGPLEALHPLDLLLEEPSSEDRARAAHYDLVSGQLNPDELGEQYRTVFLAPPRAPPAAGQGSFRAARPGQFAPCACCDKTAGYGQSSVQDHQTKGDQPFQALLGSQLRIQPPGPQAQTAFAPLRGRKVLIFSDSRQVAARLAGTLQNYSLRDAVRALLPLGYEILRQDVDFSKTLVLNHAYLAVLVAAHKLGVRLRPQLGDAEALGEVEGPSPGPAPSGVELFQLQNSLSRCPERLMQAIFDALKHTNMGLDLEALAIATIAESPAQSAKILKLPNLPGIAESDEAKLAVCRAWLRCWTLDPGIWFSDMKDSWWQTKVGSHKGGFTAMNRVLVDSQARSVFKKQWLPTLMGMFTEPMTGGVNRLVATKLTLQLGGQWRRCHSCKSVHRPVGKLATCIDCESADIGDFDPDTDEVYSARRGFYRDPIAAALQSNDPQLTTVIAAEHTAQLGAAQPDEAFSHAERHEIRFQDIDVAWRDNDRPGEPAIDVLSSTTTMEVGIDIGELSGVALRNMPPGRANYQQRAGRAGRRANAVATVVAFGSADSHDDHYFTEPAEMIRGAVIDPRLTLENPEIARRHLRAYLLQRYHEDRIPGPSPGADPNLFSVLGKVGDFKTEGSILNRVDFAKWLEDNKNELATAVDRWLPSELSVGDRKTLIDQMASDATMTIDEAIDFVEGKDGPEGSANGDAEGGDTPASEVDADADDSARVVDPATDKLLDRLLYRGVVPRYAFPTDVVAFHAFNRDQSTPFRAVIDYAPSQGLTMALSQYAPNKQLWINGKQYTSKAIYSPYSGDRRTAWGKRKLYFECGVCEHARTEDYVKARENATEDCPACKATNSFGPARVWFRPVGFAHPIDTPPETEPDAPNETARATRAKLVMQTPKPDKGWVQVSERVRAFPAREFLLVSNTGIDNEGYDYCTACGRIESTTAPEEPLWLPHARPFRSDEEGPCLGGAFAKRHIVLGTDFKTDIALFSLPLTTPFCLIPGSIEAESALRTTCEALAKAACQTLEIEPGEVLAEFRPALTEEGAAGREVEIFLYDTLPGGAGFSTELVSRAAELFDCARAILANCPEQCDASCYRCLQSFRNRMEHALLDRKLGIQFIEHVLYGGYPAYPQERAERSLGLLMSDLQRQFGSDFSFTRNVKRTDSNSGPVTIPIVARRNSTGAETWIALSSPLAPAVPINLELRSLSSQGASKLNCADDLVVRRHLPEASLRLQTAFH